MHSGYIEAGLVWRETRSGRRLSQATLWGGEIDRVRGTIRAPGKGSSALIFITMRVIELGVSTVGLMYMLAGSWVSILVYRRRLLCSLSHNYC